MWIHTVKTYVCDLHFYLSFTETYPIPGYSDLGNPELLMDKHSLSVFIYSDVIAFSICH